MQFVFILMLIFAVLVAVFALQNAHPVTIFFLKWHFEASLGLVILICLLIGAVSLGSLGLVHQTRARLKARTQGKEAEEADEEGDAEETDEPPAETLAEPKTEVPRRKPAAGTTVDLDTKMNAPGGVDDSAQEVES